MLFRCKFIIFPALLSSVFFYPLLVHVHSRLCYVLSPPLSLCTYFFSGGTHFSTPGSLTGSQINGLDKVRGRLRRLQHRGTVLVSMLGRRENSARLR